MGGHFNMNKKRKRIEKYSCDGNCYSRQGTCPRIDNCPETGHIEAFITIVSCFLIVGSVVASIGAVILFIVKLIIGVIL